MISTEDIRDILECLDQNNILGAKHRLYDLWEAIAQEDEEDDDFAWTISDEEDGDGDEDEDEDEDNDDFVSSEEFNEYLAKALAGAMGKVVCCGSKEACSDCPDPRAVVTFTISA